jgi:hypothetical protein
MRWLGPNDEVEMNTDHGGWFVVHRKARECEFFSSYPKRELDEYGAWLWLIEHAAWRDTLRSDANGRAVTVCRGQLHTSLRALQSAWRWEKSRVERYLKRLCEWDMIEEASDNGGRTLTICNYDKYQLDREADEKADEKQTGREQGSSRDTQERKKEGKKEKEKKEEIVLPDFLAEADWLRWVEYRKERDRKPMAVSTQRESIRRITLAVEAGWDAGVVISHCIERGWRGIFTPQGDPKRKPVIGHERRKELEAELFRLRGTIENAPHMRDELMPQYWAVKKELENANP